MKLEVEAAVLSEAMKRVGGFCCSGVHEVKREDGIVPRESCSSERFHLTDKLLLGLVEQVLGEPAGDVVEALKGRKELKQRRDKLYETNLSR